jgi:hypothetical protein
MVGPLRPQTDARAVVEPQTDFVADRTRDGRAFRMLCIIDKFDRESWLSVWRGSPAESPKRFDPAQLSLPVSMPA